MNNIDKEIQDIIDAKNTFDEITPEEMTDEWIQAGEYCEQTVADLRDLCKVQAVLIKSLFKVIKDKGE